MNPIPENITTNPDPTYVECVYCDQPIEDESGDAHNNCQIEVGVFACRVDEMSSNDLVKVVHQFATEGRFKVPDLSKTTDTGLINMIVWHLKRLNPRYNRDTICG